MKAFLSRVCFALFALALLFATAHRVAAQGSPIDLTVATAASPHDQLLFDNAAPRMHTITLADITAPTSHEGEGIVLLLVVGALVFVFIRYHTLLAADAAKGKSDVIAEYAKLTALLGGLLGHKAVNVTAPPPVVKPPVVVATPPAQGAKVPTSAQVAALAQLADANAALSSALPPGEAGVVLQASRLAAVQAAQAAVVTANAAAG